MNASTAPAARTDRTHLFAAGVIAIVLPAAALALYARFGEPRATEGGSLRQHLADRPTDGRGWMLLAREEMDRGRYVEAAAAYERAIAASKKVAGDPVVWCELADALGMAQGRRLAGRPAELIGRALAIDGRQPCAREMSGSAAYEAGDFAAAARHWRELLGQLPAGQPAHRELAAAVARAERLALK